MFLASIVTMSRLAVVLLFASSWEVSLAQTPICKQNCYGNETFTDCSAGNFQATCWNRYPPTKFIDCDPGCVCRLGFIRDPNSYQCIAIKSCPRSPREGSRLCPRNEEYSECGFGCDEHCGLANRDLTCRSCFQGCICRKGYVRSLATGQCIIKTTCKRELSLSKCVRMTLIDLHFSLSVRLLLQLKVSKMRSDMQKLADS